MAKHEKDLKDLFHETLKDIYFAEKQILRALPKMAKAAQSDELRQAFETHRDETESQIERLDQVFEIIGKSPHGKTCEAIIGIIDEGKEVMEDFAGDGCAGPWPARRRSGSRALRNQSLRNAEDLGAAAWSDGGGSAA